MKTLRIFLVAVLALAAGTLSPLAQSGGISGVVDIDSLLGLGGGDGDSPWPGVLHIPRVERHYMYGAKEAAALGDAILFSWTQPGRGGTSELWSVRLSREEGSESVLVDSVRGAVSDLSFVGSSAGAALSWRRVNARGAASLWVQALDRQGRPAGAPQRLTTLGPAIRAHAVFPMGGGEYFIARAREDGAAVVIEIGSDQIGYVPFGTARWECDVELRFVTTVGGTASLEWTEREPDRQAAGRARERSISRRGYAPISRR